MFNFALFSIPNGGKIAPSIYSALKVSRNDRVTSEESKAKSRI